ncbi:hypothetical protein EPD60_14070 [Flaviaesturariibacter flavus]|uniref:Uncharacterized protein n=1 Tax=Flaviaesturariibacter flavus TaxID=2502780 RepID=A0A4R1B3H4_9BACT|nr:hypothetical protein [Flaviaesturariibacter flavus]TCJ12401.1 hypothetical protein EPD60_14070 [Flaviaesturariibacter flavus]
MRKTRPFLLVLLFGMTLLACKSKTEDFTPAAPAQYVQLQPGKFIIYSVDSTIFTNSGRDIEHRRYQERHVVDSLITDGLGRPSWRVYRSVRDSAGTTAWSPRGTYLLTLTGSTLETFEDNLRFISLASPLRPGASWKGGRYLGTAPYSGVYSYGSEINIADWDFTVQETGGSENINGTNYNDVLTINAVDESVNLPITPQTVIASRSLYTTKWAAGIGLVYQNYILWEYQFAGPPNTPYYIGFGVERSILQHN